MARPVHANAEATRTRILAEASRLFAERDQGGASFRDIAAAAGVSIGTVHHYFGGKDALHSACIDAMYEELGNLQTALWPALLQGSAHEIIRVALHKTFRFARGHRQSLILLMREVIRAGELNEARREGFHRPFLDTASTMLSQQTGVPPVRCRLTLQSGIHLVVRYALSSDRDLLMIAGFPEDQSDNPDVMNAALESIEAHMLRLLTHELGVEEPSHV